MQNNRFDAVVCTVSVEYLIKPVEVFAEVKRILKPGGRFIVTFSNRWFPPKVVRVWEGIHEFERMGLVLEYFLLAGGFSNLETWSLRGLPRPLDDKYAGQIGAFRSGLCGLGGEGLMHGVDPYGYMQQVAGNLDRLNSRQELETVLDEVEYLFEVLDPELQDIGYELIERIQTKLRNLP